MSVPLQSILNKKTITDFFCMKDFKRTLYIQLLSKGEASIEEFEGALSDFTRHIYEFCMNESDVGFIYFSLNNIRILLIHIEEMRVTTDSKLSANGGIAFIDAAIEWVVKQEDARKCKTPQVYNDGNCRETAIQNKEEEEDELTEVIWTGKIIHLMEFIYGADTLKNFNNGQATIKQVAAYFSKVLGIEIKDPSGCYVSMRERIKESRTSYIDSMREALLERMEKDDEKTYRRKK